MAGANRKLVEEVQHERHVIARPLLGGIGGHERDDAGTSGPDAPSAVVTSGTANKSKLVSGFHTWYARRAPSGDSDHAAAAPGSNRRRVPEESARCHTMPAPALGDSL